MKKMIDWILFLMYRTGTDTMRFHHKDIYNIHILQNENAELEILIMYPV